MENNKRSPKTMKSAGFFQKKPLVLIAAALAFYGAAVVFLGRYWEPALLRMMKWLRISQINGYAALFLRLLVLLIALLLFCGVTGQSRIFRQRRTSFGRALVPGLYMLVFALGSMAYNLTLAEWFQPWQTIFWSALYYSLVAVTEELVFRGIVADQLLRFVLRRHVSVQGAEEASKTAGEGDLAGRREVYMAAIVSGLIFALAHAGNLRQADVSGVAVQMLGAFLMGLVLTAIYYRTSNLWVVIFLHAVNDIAAAFPVTVIRSGMTTAEMISGYGLWDIVSLLLYIIVFLVVLRPKKAEEIANANKFA